MMFMKSRFLVQAFCVALAVCGCSSYRPQPPACSLRDGDVRWFQGALDGWHQVSKDFLLLDPKPIPWVVLFDGACTWHLAATAGIPGSEPAGVRFTYAGEPVPARVLRHNGTVHLPNGTDIPAEIMAAAFSAKGGETAFFALATLDLWRHHPQASKDPELERRLLSVVLHEIMHTRQLHYVSLKVDDLKKRFEIPAEVNDDMVENRFKDVSGFREAFNAERDLLYRAVAEADPVQRRALIDQALGMARQRRDRFFTGADRPYAELEELFLNMEGAAEWARFKYHQAEPGNTLSDAEIIAFIRGKENSFSQDEGLALVLLLEKEVPGWQPRLLGPEMASPFKLLEGRQARATTRPTRSPSARR